MWAFFRFKFGFEQLVDDLNHWRYWHFSIRNLNIETNEAAKPYTYAI